MVLLKVFSFFVGMLLIAEFAAGSLTQEVSAELLAPLPMQVAYLYRAEHKIDQNLISRIQGQGFGVELINENALVGNNPKNLSTYRFVFVGDENFRNWQKIPVGERPTIVASKYNSEKWGLTNSDGVGQLGSTSPLTVVIGEESVHVYDSAFSSGRVAVPYYYLGENNMPQGFIQIASTPVTSSGVNFGSVISYALPGVLLKNSKVVRANTCFYGIIATDYWTPDAAELFDDCISFVATDALR